MSAQPGTISDRLFYAFAHPLQRRRYYLALVFSTLLFPLIAAALILGTIVLVVPIIALFVWLGSRVVFARLLANSILVSEVNYPRVHGLAEELKVTMGYNKPVYIFVYEQGNFNAYMRYFFFRRAIFLNSELLESGVSDDEVRWIVGRFIGYLRTRQQAGVLGWLVRAAQHLVVFNIFILPYERAMVYTGDRLAVAAIGGDITSAISAMQKLLVGRQLGYSVNPEGIIDQQRRVKGTFFGFLARLMSGFPHMTTRYVDLIVFAKAYFPAQFTRFAAANPGLPADLASLAASPQSGNAPSDDRFAAATRPPNGWPWAIGTTAAVLLLGVFGWYQMPDQSVSTDDMPSIPAATTPDTTTPDSTSPVLIDPSTGLPPHVHKNAAGKLVPDDGCDWASSDPDDFSVTCKDD